VKADEKMKYFPAKQHMLFLIPGKANSRKLWALKHHQKQFPFHMRMGLSGIYRRHNGDLVALRHDQA